MLFSQIACKRDTHLHFFFSLDDILFGKVTISASLKKIHFPTILEQALLNESTTTKQALLNESTTTTTTKKGRAGGGERIMEI